MKSPHKMMRLWIISDVSQLDTRKYIIRRNILAHTYCEAFQYDYTVGSSFQHLFRFCSVNTAHPSPSPLRPRKRSRCRPPSGLIMMYRDLLFRPICLYERSVPSTRLTKSAGTSYTLIYVNWGRPPRRCSMLCLSVMGMYNRPFNPIANRKIPGMHWYLCLIYMKVINHQENSTRIRKVFTHFDIALNIILGFHEKTKPL